MFLILSIHCVNAQVENMTSTNKLIIPEFLDQLIVNNMEVENISGLTACIVKGGETVWTGNYGYANRETNKLVDNSTVFLLYSITKTFTGIGLMQLYENNLFQLSDPINDYLPFDVTHPDHPDTDITFEMLMTHTSGIKDNWSVINSLMVYNEDTGVSIADFLEAYLVDGGTYYGENYSFTNSNPGSSFSYSNVGATLGGYLIEIISGTSYSDYISDSILTPLGMSNSNLYLSEIETDDLAVEYDFISGDYLPKGYMSNPTLPAGFMHASCDDMAKYLKMLINRGVLNDLEIIGSDLFESMIVEVNPDVAQNSGYFFGYDDVNDLWGHTGGYNGVKTAMFFDKDDDWGVVLLSNGDGEPWQILYSIYQYAIDFINISPSYIDVLDENENSILESNETVNLQIYVCNNSIIDFSDIDVELSCEDGVVAITDSYDFIESLQSKQTTTEPLNFVFDIGVISEGHNANYKLSFLQDGNVLDSAYFSLCVGTTDVLIVNDEEHLYRSRVRAEEYYIDAIENNNRTCQSYDINLLGVPDLELLRSFSAVVWFTSLDDSEYHTIMSTSEQELIQDYLDVGGKLFVSSQNLSDALVGTDFLSNYLKCEHVDGTWSGSYIVEGIENSIVGDDLVLQLSGGDGSNNQYSISTVSAINGSANEFEFISSTSSAGISFDGEYKLVFFPFCFSAINNQGDRDEVMHRVLDFFGLYQVLNGYDNDILDIYPNPTNDLLNISLPDEVFKFAIINAMGQIVLEGKETVIDVSDIVTGVYLLRIECWNKTVLKKLIIN